MNIHIHNLITEYGKQHFMEDIIDIDDENKNIDVVNDFVYNNDHPQNKKELKEIIKKYLSKYKYNLNSIDVSLVKDFSYLFSNMKVNNIDISMWDVTNGLSFTGMFSTCDASLFNCDLSLWGINPEADTTFMFIDCTLMSPEHYPMLTEKQNKALIGDVDYYKPVNQNSLKKYIKLMLKNNITDLNFIDVSDIRDFSSLFSMQMHTNFDVSKWDVRNGRKFTEMFWKCKKFNCDLSEWEMEGVKVTDIDACHHMFTGCESLDLTPFIKIWKRKYPALGNVDFET